MPVSEHGPTDQQSNNLTSQTLGAALNMSGLFFLNVYEIINTVMLRLYMFLPNLYVNTTLENIYLLYCCKT